MKSVATDLVLFYIYIFTFSSLSKENAPGDNQDREDRERHLRSTNPAADDHLDYLHHHSLLPVVQGNVVGVDHRLVFTGTGPFDLLDLLLHNADLLYKSCLCQNDHRGMVEKRHCSKHAYTCYP